MKSSSKQDKSGEFTISGFIERILDSVHYLLLNVWYRCFQCLPDFCCKNRAFRKKLAGWLFFAAAAGIILAGLFTDWGIFDDILLCFGTALLGIGIAFGLLRKLNCNWIRNLVFVGIFTCGTVSYMQVLQTQHEAPQNHFSASDNSSGSKSISVKTEKPVSGAWNTLLAGCKSLSCFFPSRGSYDTLDTSPDYTDPLYVIFQIAVYIFFIYVALMLWGERVCNGIMNYWTLDRNKYVFWCKTINSQMNYLAKDILNDDSWSRIVFSVSEQQNLDKAHWLYREANSHFYVLKMRKPGEIHPDCLKARSHFFITDDYNWNIRKANDFLKEMKNNETFAPSPIKLYIKTNDSMESFYYEKWADMVHAEAAAAEWQVEIEFINESELIARNMVEKYPMLKCPGIVIDHAHAKIKEGKFKTLILGFGNHGKEILRAIVEDGQFIHSKPSEDDFRVDIFDKKPGVLDWFFKKYPDANRYCRMDLGHLDNYQLDVFSGRFYDYLSQKNILDSYTRIVVCLGDDKLNLNAAMMIEKIAKFQKVSLKDKLFVVLSGSNSFVEFISDAKQRLNDKIDFSGCKIDPDHNMIVIGSPEEIFSYDKLLSDGIIETQGKLLNLVYELGDLFDSKKIRSSEKPLKWLKRDDAIAFYDLDPDPQKTTAENHSEKKQIVSFFNRKSNIASAKGFRNIILLQEDCTVSEADKRKPAEVSGKLLETLAETEHLRWNAFHFMQGIRTWYPKKADLSPNSRPNDILNHERHAALVDYDRLPDVDELFGKDRENLKNFDRNIIKNIRSIRSYPLKEKL